MKKAILLALVLAGCQTKAEADRQQAEAVCRTSPEWAECVQVTLQHYAILDRFAANRVAAQPAPVYYPQGSVAVPVSDAPVLQNIIPPTVRCQSVPAGMGTVQTVCR